MNRDQLYQDGREAQIGDAQADYAELAGIIDDAFEKS